MTPWDIVTSVFRGALIRSGRFLSSAAEVEGISASNKPKMKWTTPYSHVVDRCRPSSTRIGSRLDAISKWYVAHHHFIVAKLETPTAIKITAALAIEANQYARMAT